MEICHCWRLKRAAHHLNEFYDKALAPSGVTISQYGMLREINQHGGCSVMDLAGYLDLERSTLTRSLKTPHAKRICFGLPGMSHEKLPACPDS